MLSVRYMCCKYFFLWHILICKQQKFLIFMKSSLSGFLKWVVLFMSYKLLSFKLGCHSALPGYNRSLLGVSKLCVPDRTPDSYPLSPSQTCSSNSCPQLKRWNSLFQFSGKTKNQKKKTALFSFSGPTLHTTISKPNWNPLQNAPRI